MKLVIIIATIVFSLSFNIIEAAEAEAGNLSTPNLEANSEKKIIKKQAINKAVLGMNVSGNKELPNVLYIIPWKNSYSHSFNSKPMPNIILDEIYAPIDPQAFAKKVKFYHQITSNEAGK